MTKEEQEFLEKNFPAGSFTQVTILVKNESLEKLMDVLRNANLTLAAIPSAKQAMDFATDDGNKNNGH
jgi:hypothetical protein